MNCPRCGAFPPPYAQACPQCGTPFGFAAGPAMAPVPVDPRTGASSGAGIAVVIVAVVGAVMMLGVVGALVFVRSSAPSEQIRFEPTAVATAEPLAPPTVDPIDPEEAPPPATRLGPVTALPRASPPSTKSLTVVVKNHRDAPVDLFWITFKGGRQRYATIPAGGVYRQQTYAGHAWVVLTGTSQELGGFVAAQAQVDPLATGGFTQKIDVE